MQGNEPLRTIDCGVDFPPHHRNWRRRTSISFRVRIKFVPSEEFRPLYQHTTCAHCPFCSTRHHTKKTDSDVLPARSKPGHPVPVMVCARFVFFCDVAFDWGRPYSALDGRSDGLTVFIAVVVRLETRSITSHHSTNLGDVFVTPL